MDGEQTGVETRIAWIAQQDMQDIIATDFMKDIIKDLSLDIDPGWIIDLLEGKKKEEEDKDKKDADKKW